MSVTCEALDHPNTRPHLMFPERGSCECEEAMYDRPPDVHEDAAEQVMWDHDRGAITRHELSGMVAAAIRVGEKCQCECDNMPLLRQWLAALGVEVSS